MDSETFNIEAVMYTRPDGESHRFVYSVPDSPLAREKYQELRDCEIDITFETVWANTINVCLDDGDFDYKTMLWQNDPSLPERVGNLICEFDRTDYEEMAHLWAVMNG